jgi:MFS family permease
MSRRLNPWLLVALLWVVALLNYLDRQVIFSLFPLVGKDLNAGSVELGLTSTVFLWVYGLLSPFAGYLADRFGRARVVLISLLVWSAVTWLTGHAQNITQLLTARALMGISEACYLPAALAMIVEAHSERSRSLATGLHQSGLYAGVVLGGVGGGWMGQHYGWRPVFIILGGVGLAYVTILYFFLRRAGESRAAAAHAPRFASSMKTLLGLPGFKTVVAAFSLFSFAGWVAYTWLPVFLYEQFRMSLTEAGFFATFFIQAASFAGVVTGGIFADRWSRRSPRARLLTQAVGLAIGAPFLFVIGLTASQVLLILALATYGLGRGFYDPTRCPWSANLRARVARLGLRHPEHGRLRGGRRGGGDGRMAEDLPRPVGGLRTLRLAWWQARSYLRLKLPPRTA